MTTARVETVDGQIVLVDPAAVAMARAVAKHNCRRTTLKRHNADRMRHFVRRIAERGDDPQSVVIVCLNVDDAHGGQLAEVLMPGGAWQVFRDRGETPFVRGLAERDGILHALGLFDKEAHDKLLSASGVAIVVVDFGVAEVFGPEDLS